LGVSVIETSADSNVDMAQQDVVLLDIHSITDELNLDALFPQWLTERIPPPMMILGTGVKGLSQSLGNRKFVCINSPITGKKLMVALRTVSSTKPPIPISSHSEVSHPIDETSISSWQKNGTAFSPGNEISGPPGTTTSQPALSNLSELPERPVQVPSQSTSIKSPSIPASECRFKRFLLVDDNSINRKVLAAFVKRLDRPYVTASDGAEAVRLYQKAALDEADSFDCIFMDVSMPVMDGFQAVVAIWQFEMQQQQAKPGPQTDGAVDRALPAATLCSYIFALTGLGSEEARSSARISGVDTFLLKPLKFKDVEPLLRAMT
jgi:CheY-like chemotaxis protein